jgi:hypothetical protein
MELYEMAKPRKKLPKDVRAARWKYAERLFAQGLTISEVNKNIVAKYKRPMGWTTYRAMQQRILAGQATPKDLDQGNALDSALVSVQPLRQVSSKLRMRLQGLVNDMRKGGVEKLTIDSAGTVQVTFTPAEQLFDLEA